MELLKLLDGIEKYVLHGPKEPNIEGMAYDSRKVKPGDLFFCIKGYQTDGHQYAQSAAEKGAVAVVTEHWMPLPEVPEEHNGKENS